MDLRLVRVDADLHDRTRASDPGGVPLADQDGVGLDLDREEQPARVRENVEEVLAQEDLAAAEGQEEDAGVGELVEQALTSRVVISPWSS